VRRFCVFLENGQDGSASNFFQGLGQNTCSLQSALKNIAFKLNTRNILVVL